LPNLVRPSGKPAAQADYRSRTIKRPSPSLAEILTDKMIALRQDRIRRVIGHIDKETSEQLDRALLVVLGLTR
jgi:mRNA-degrading endonuclease toxin of MazEF toxin-antitoxin module